MKIRKRISLRVAALVACALVAPHVAAQQSLALSYKLDVGADGAQVTAPLINRCAGFSWTALAGCGRELLTRIAPARERPVGRVPAAEEATAPVSAVAGESAPMRAADENLTLVPVSADARSLRPSAARDALTSASRSPDLSLRLGSKHRFKASEDSGTEWYRFSDTTYQTHLQNNGHKALGVELLVPFQ